LKKVLLISYQYPPEGGSSGVLRPLKFSKYLPLEAWTPHVLTLRESFYPIKDEGLVRDIPPEAVLHRTLALDNSRHLAIKRRYLGFLSVPDRFVSWLFFGVPKGLSVIHNEGIRVIYSTSPPATAHLIALALKSITRVRWIADFRDPWIEEGSFPVPGTIRFRIESTLERMVMHRSDVIVVTTAYLKTEFLSRYPELSPDKIQVIYNGYDETDFSQINIPCWPKHFEIIHAGLVTREFRNPLPLLEVLASLLTEGALLREDLKVTFLGGDWWVSSPEFTAAVTRLDLHGVVSVEGRVSHHESLNRQARAAVLLLLQASDDTRNLIPAKAFEYLRIGRPILALTLEGATADLLKGRDHCAVATPTDLQGLRKAVLDLYQRWRIGESLVDHDRNASQFERRHLTHQLANILDKLTT
jgi:glycosyltransferase involved in cell wall biosynthesis